MKFRQNLDNNLDRIQTLFRRIQTEFRHYLDNFQIEFRQFLDRIQTEFRQNLDNFR